MSTEKMRAEFEKFRDEHNATLESEGHKPGSKWHVTNAHYPTWQASRAAIEVEFPEQRNVPDRDCWARTNALGYNTANHECRTAIESLGLKVKPC